MTSVPDLLHEVSSVTVPLRHARAALPPRFATATCSNFLPAVGVCGVGVWRMVCCHLQIVVRVVAGAFEFLLYKEWQVRGCWTSRGDLALFTGDHSKWD